jgi:hypothetical protein
MVYYPGSERERPHGGGDHGLYPVLTSTVNTRTAAMAVVGGMATMDIVIAVAQ